MTSLRLNAPLASFGARPYLRLLDPKHLAGKRRILYVTLLIVLAVVTPTTDVASLLVVFVPAVLFLEAGLGIARVVHTRRG